MKKFFALISMVMLGLAAQAAASVSRNGYVHWTLDPVSESMKFAYVMVAADDGVNTTYLTINGTSSTVVVGDSYPEETTALNASYYSQVVDSSDDTRYYIELYDAQGNKITSSQYVSYSSLVSGGYIYEDMSTSGILNPFHFAAQIPEPTGGLLVALGLGLLALRRKRDDEVA